MIETLLQTTLSPAALGTGLFLLLAYFANFIFQQQKNDGKTFKLSTGPWLGNRSTMDMREAVVTGYEKYNSKGKPYVLDTAHVPTVILPVKYLNEIKSLPDSTLSFHGAIYKRLQGKYLGMEETPTHTVAKSVQVDLTRNISHTLSMLQEEMAFAAPDALGPCDDWTPVPIYAKLLRVVALISGRVFVGLPLCRDEKWIDISINYTVDLFKGPTRFWAYKAWQRPFIAPFVKEVATIRQHKEAAKKLLTPIFEQRMRDMREKGEEGRKNDMIQWLMENAGEKAMDMDYQVQNQLGVSVAAIHTTSMNVTQVLYDLTSRPEYIEPLREEIKQVLAADNGKLVKKSMTKLRKLDSFIKESQRVNPAGLATMSREVLKPITFSDGTILSKGIFVAMPAHQLNMDSKLWENPEEFDGFRFEKLRAKEGNDNKFQFVTTGADNLNFGHGVHACPGRFFASNEIKVLLVHFLMHYDIRTMDGQEKRPENFYQQMSVIPDARTLLQFKRREVVG
jgi:cytochrome P450